MVFVREFDTGEQFARYYEDWGVNDVETARWELAHSRLLDGSRAMVVAMGDVREWTLRLTDDPETLAGIRDGCIEVDA